MRKNVLLFLLFSAFSVGINAQTQIDSLINVLPSISNAKERLATLDMLTREMIRTHHEEQKEYISAYMTLARELEAYDLMAIKSRFLIQQYIYAKDYKKAMQLCDSMLAYKDQFKQKKSEAHILLKKGGVLFDEQDYKLAIQFYDTAAALFMESKDSIFAADAYYFSSDASLSLGEFHIALPKAEKAYKLYEKLGDYTYMFATSQTIGILLKKNGLFVEKEKFFSDLIEKSKQYKFYDFLPANYLSIAEQQGIHKGDLELAKKYIDSAALYIPKIQKSFYCRNATARNFYAISMLYYLEKNDQKQADHFFEKMQHIEKEIRCKRQINTTNGHKIKYYIAKKNYTKALEYLETYQEDFSSVDLKNLDYISSEKLYADVYTQMGNYRKANQHLQRFLRYKDSLSSAFALGAYTFHQAKFKTSEKEKEIILQEAEIQQLEAEKEIGKNKRNALLAISLSVVLILLGLWWYAHLKRKQLSEELKKNKEELKQFTQQLMHKSEEQFLLQDKLNELRSEDQEQESIKVIKDLADSKILTKEDWYLFKEKFVKVYPHFFIRIFKNGYQLTQSEERLVALEKLGLNNHEISKMLGVSQKTVVMSRYRLRKKVNAEKDISIISFFERGSGLQLNSS